MRRLECNAGILKDTQGIQLPYNTEEERRLHREGYRLQTPTSKRLLNAATQELKELLNNNKNDSIQIFLQGLTPTESTDYSLWKATKKLKHVKKTFSDTMDIIRAWVRSNRKSTCFH
jgi:hypothetical protein